MTVEHTAALIIVCVAAAIWAVGFAVGIHTVTSSIRAGWRSGWRGRALACLAVAVVVLWPLWLVETTVRRLAAALRDTTTG